MLPPLWFYGSNAVKSKSRLCDNGVATNSWCWSNPSSGTSISCSDWLELSTGLILIFRAAGFFTLDCAPVALGEGVLRPQAAGERAAFPMAPAPVRYFTAPVISKSAVLLDCLISTPQRKWGGRPATVYPGLREAEPWLLEGNEHDHLKSPFQLEDPSG
ncbi:hypothetical protein CB1_001107036 [Camelus ferus]|nr:hypothetical protein CB1_001107036 [Camelus ferus]